MSWPSWPDWKDQIHETDFKPIRRRTGDLPAHCRTRPCAKLDLSPPIQSLLQGIVDALTGPLGVVIATLAVLGVFLSWFFNIIDLRQALWVLVA